MAIRINEKKLQEIRKDVGPEKFDAIATVVNKQKTTVVAVKVVNKELITTPAEEDNTNEIIRLHNGIVKQLAQSLNDALAIGELLFKQKELIKYGEFTKWAVAKLPFSVRTAQNYMKLYQYKDALNAEKVTQITDAYHHIFSKPISNEVIEVDDNINVSGTCIIVPPTNLDKIKLPKKTAKGRMETIHMTDHRYIDEIINGEWYGKYEETFAKLVIHLVSNDKNNKRLGEFICAFQKYMRPGGKIIIVKI